MAGAGPCNVPFRMLKALTGKSALEAEAPMSQSALEAAAPVSMCKKCILT